MQSTAFGARDRGYFDRFGGAPWRRLMRNRFGGSQATRYSLEIWYNPRQLVMSHLTLHWYYAMPASYTMLWSQDYCRYLASVNQIGNPLRFVWGGHNQDTRFSQMHLAQADRIYPLAVTDKQLYVVTRMDVEQLLTRAGFEHLYPEYTHLIRHPCADEIVLGEAGLPIRFDVAVPAAILEAMRFTAQRRVRPIKYVVDGKLERTISIQGVYRLAPESAAALDPLLETA